ncbi:hypothetical protein DB42_CV00230 [Neochlamydia sp. EPS4]|nr:hypothetical protein DB42_CV00230 [Neochlamydia sp. EPS4]
MPQEPSKIHLSQQNESCLFLHAHYILLIVYKQASERQNLHQFFLISSPNLFLMLRLLGPYLEKLLLHLFHTTLWILKLFEIFLSPNRAPKYIF